jgi:hypothetical protein
MLPRNQNCTLAIEFSFITVRKGGDTVDEQVHENLTDDQAKRTVSGYVSRQLTAGSVI